jgi:serine/threonine protein kinase
VCRDLKPSAIFFGAADTIKVADFSTTMPVASEAQVVKGRIGTPTFRAPGM